MQWNDKAVVYQEPGSSASQPLKSSAGKIRTEPSLSTRKATWFVAAFAAVLLVTGIVVTLILRMSASTSTSNNTSLPVLSNSTLAVISNSTISSSESSTGSRPLARLSSTFSTYSSTATSISSTAEASSSTAFIALTSSEPVVESTGSVTLNASSTGATDTSIASTGLTNTGGVDVGATLGSDTLAHGSSSSTGDQFESSTAETSSALPGTDSSSSTGLSTFESTGGDFLTSTAADAFSSSSSTADSEDAPFSLSSTADSEDVPSSFSGTGGAQVISSSISSTAASAVVFVQPQGSVVPTFDTTYTNTHYQFDNSAGAATYTSYASNPSFQNANWRITYTKGSDTVVIFCPSYTVNPVNNATDSFNSLSDKIDVLKNAVSFVWKYNNCGSGGSYSFGGQVYNTGDWSCFTMLTVTSSNGRQIQMNGDGERNCFRSLVNGVATGSFIPSVSPYWLYGGSS